MTESLRIGGPPQSPSPRVRAHRAYWLLAGAAVLVLAGGAAWAGISVARHDVAAAPSPTSSPRTQVFRVFGYVDLNLGEFEWSDKPNSCWGYNGYEDIHEGTPVVVTDAAGTTVAIGKLGPGVPKGTADKADSCTFSWEVLNVPVGSDFYGVEVSHRGRIQRPAAEITNRFDLGFS